MSERYSARLQVIGMLSLSLMIGSMTLPLSTSMGQEPSESELPKHALHRFGEYGKTPEKDGTNRLQYSPDGKLLALRSRNNVVSIMEIESQKQLCSVNGHENNWIETIDFSPDSKHFVTAAGSSEKVKVWNSRTGKMIGEMDTDGNAAYFSRNGSTIHVLGESHVENYSFPGLHKASQQKWKTGNESRIAMSKDGRIVVTFRSLKRQIYQMQVHDLENKSVVTLDGPTSIPISVVVSANQLWVAAAYARETKIRLWDLRDPHQKKYTLAIHEKRVQSLSFSSDSRFLVSSGWDEKVNAWDLLTRQLIGTFEGHSDHVNATAFSPLGLTFASGASGAKDCSTIIWDMNPLVVPKTEKPAAKDFEKIWTDLGLNSLQRSLAATSQLINGGEEYLALLQKRVSKSLGERTSGNVAELIQLLKSPKFKIRENATAQLMKVRSQVDAELRAALETQRSPEIRYRLKLILKTKLNRRKVSVVDQRRWHRIIFALELMATDSAQQFLGRIAEGHEDIDIANDAKGAFDRNLLRKSLGLVSAKPKYPSMPMWQLDAGVWETAGK